MSLGAIECGQIGQELSALSAANPSSHWQPGFLKTFVYAKVPVLSMRFPSRYSLLVAWPGVIAEKERGGRKSISLKVGGGRCLSPAFIVVGCWAGRAGGLTRMAVTKPGLSAQRLRREEQGQRFGDSDDGVPLMLVVHAFM